MVVRFAASLIGIFACATGIFSVPQLVRMVLGLGEERDAGEVAPASEEGVDGGSEKWVEARYDRFPTSKWRLWIHDGEERTLLIEHWWAMSEAQLSPSGDRVAVVGPGHTISVVNADGSLLHSFEVRATYWTANERVKNLAWVGDETLRVFIGFDNADESELYLDSFKLGSPGDYEINLDLYNSVVSVTPWP